MRTRKRFLYARVGLGSRSAALMVAAAAASGNIAENQMLIVEAWYLDLAAIAVKLGIDVSEKRY